MAATVRILFRPCLSQLRRTLSHLPPAITGSTLPSLRRRIRMSSTSPPPPPPELAITLPSGDRVPVVAAPGLTDADLRSAVGSALFKQWVENMHSGTGLLSGGNMSLRQVHIQIPGIVFARGESVAVLIILESGGEDYVILTEQFRVPVGKFVLELPAGMIDDEKGDVVGAAVREVEEETGICLKVEDMVNLTAFLGPATGRKVYPSPGGSDEAISLFLYRGQVEEETIRSLHGRELGLRDHGELIKVHVVPYEKLWHSTVDAKALTAIALYEMAKRNGLLPQRNP